MLALTLARVSPLGDIIMLVESIYHFLVLPPLQDLQQDFKNREDSLESINTRGTALVDACLDELSRDSGRIKISDLNDAWGNALSQLSGREEKLKEGIALAEKYQVITSNL